MNKVTKEETQHVANLSKLSLNNDELPKFNDQLNSMLGLFDELSEVNTDGIQPTFTVSDQIDITREDIAQNWNQKDALLNNAPESVDGLIRVPAIMDGSDE